MPEMLGNILRNLFSKPATVKYPFERPEQVPGTRGELSFDMAKCDQCQDCERLCPSGAIEVDVEGKRVEWDPYRCMYCHLCVRSCMHQAITPLDHVQAPGYKPEKRVFES